VNFFQPQMKLVAKTRRGAKVSKTFDTARTPYQRVLDSPELTQGAKTELTRIYLDLNPAQLKREIGRCQDRLIEIARTKPERRKEVRRSPDHPFGETFSPRQRSRTSLVRQPMDASRTS